MSGSRKSWFHVILRRLMRTDIICLLILFECFVCSWQIKRNIILFAFRNFRLKEQLSCHLFEILHVLNSIVPFLKYLHIFLNFFFCLLVSLRINLLNWLKILLVLLCDEELSIIFTSFWKHFLCLIRIWSYFTHG